jgi:peptidoglycan hydrolase-like protein with peptidoglycan-binding domain
MRLPVLLAIALVAVPVGAATPAHAAICSASASAVSGPAPLPVTFTADGCSGSAYHWDFGDSQAADGATVTHTFTPGAFTVTFSVDGSVVTTFAIESQALQLDLPAVTQYGETSSIAGRLLPAKNAVDVDLLLGDNVVTHTQTVADGSFVFNLRLETPGPYIARSGAVVSDPTIAPIQPRLTTSLKGERIVGQSLLLYSRLQPAGAGTLRLVAVRRGHRVMTRAFSAGDPFRLPTSLGGTYTAWVAVVPSDGYQPAGDEFHFEVTAPPLRVGSRGPSVRLLERELVAHHFALPRTDSIFGADTLEAVYAVQKLAGLPRTGSMSAATWLALGRDKLPRPRLRGNYIEVDKTKQVLYVVRNSKVTLIVPVSTGATGNTPVGLFHVYSKVPGGAVMYYSNYFTGAFAIHGYVVVPPYPASHGCVRVPMWVAIRLYSLIPPYTRVLIHY